MRRLIAILLTISLLPLPGFADNSCKAFANVTFSMDGISKLSSTIITQQFALLKNRIDQKANFKKILVRSVCPNNIDTATTECIVFKGIPALDDNGVPTFDGTRPIQFDLEVHREPDFNLELAEPISCVNFVCKVRVRIVTLKVDGTVTNLKYSDNLAMIAQRLKPIFTLVKPAYYNMQVTLNPFADDLNHLATTTLMQQRIEVPMGAIQVSLRALDTKTTDETKAHLFADALRAELKDYTKDMQTPAWGHSQVAKFEVNFTVNKISEIDHQRYPPSGVAPYCGDQQTEKLRDACVTKQQREMKADMQAARAAYRKYFADNHTSEKQMALAARETNIPTNMSDAQIIAFFNNPPSTLHAEDFTQMYLHATNIEKSEEEGWADQDIGSFVVVADDFIRKFMPTIFDREWLNLIKNDLRPAVVALTNADFTTLSADWDLVTRIPNLDLQLITKKSALMADLATAQANLAKSNTAANQAQVSLLKAQLATLAKQMSADWLPIGTSVVFDHSNPSPNLLQGHVFEKGKSCLNVAPSPFALANDDLVTDFNIDTIRLYAQEMVKTGKLSFCAGSDDPNCKGGTSVVINQMPIITCDNGVFSFDFGFRVRGFGASTKIAGLLGNCSGSPCFRLKSAEASLNGFVLNLFVGGILNRALTSALKTADGLPMPITDVALTDAETLPKTCDMRLKWSVQTTPITPKY